MKIYGVVGYRNAGKTTLVERLVSAFTARGLGVSTVKHAHHDVDPEEPGKDTWRHRQAGAQQVVLATPHRWMLMSELRAAPPPPLTELLTRLDPVDLVLVEGYKRDRHRKIEVHRQETGHPLIAPDDPTVRAIASDAPLSAPCPVLDLNYTDAVADFILADLAMDSGESGR